MFPVWFVHAIPLWVLVTLYVGGMVVLTLSMAPSQGMTRWFPTLTTFVGSVLWTTGQGILLYRGYFSLTTLAFLDAAAYPLLAGVVGTLTSVETWSGEKAIKLIIAMCFIVWAQHPGK